MGHDSRIRRAGRTLHRKSSIVYLFQRFGIFAVAYHQSIGTRVNIPLYKLLRLQKCNIKKKNHKPLLKKKKPNE